MPVTAGIVGGLGAIGSLGGAAIQSSAAQQASQQQASLGYAGLAQQQNMFNVAQGLLKPYITAGQTSGIPWLQSTMQTLQGLTTPGSSAATLASMPGFQFQQYWGTKAAQNALTAQGLGGSVGPVATAISNYNQGLAGTYWQNAVNALLGQAGVAQNLINTGSLAGQSLASGAIQSGNAQASTLQGIGSAQAAGTLGSANAIAGGLTGGSSSISNALLLNSLLGSGNQGLYGTKTSPFVAGGPDD